MCCCASCPTLSRPARHQALLASRPPPLWAPSSLHAGSTQWTTMWVLGWRRPISARLWPPRRTCPSGRPLACSPRREAPEAACLWTAWPSLRPSAQRPLHPPPWRSACLAASRAWRCFALAPWMPSRLSAVQRFGPSRQQAGTAWTWPAKQWVWTFSCTAWMLLLGRRMRWRRWLSSTDSLTWMPSWWRCRCRRASRMMR
mmetsp:Transcript_44411/g.112376  ORF Transcript_44411/g.112376 Transcript_44411/m.112376 type:complete len:200 (+) Transcript_44411:1-600(+)